MANKILNMIFKATDKATPVINDIKGTTGGTQGIGGLTAALSDLVGPATIAAGAVVLVGGAVADMMKDWQDHVLGIRDFAEVLGITNAEASGLVSIASDYGMSAGDMLTAMERLVEKGLDPTIGGLREAKELIEEAEDPTTRLTTAIDLLGKKGAEELIPMFSEWDKVFQNYIDHMGDSAVVTDEMVDKALKQRDAMNELSGAWAGLKLQAAGWAAPGLTALIELLTTPFGSDSAAAFINKFFGLGGGDMPSLSTVGSGSGGGFVRRSESSTGSSVVSSGGGGGGSRLQEFQHGGDFWVGGSGGIDSTRVSFMATPGEPVRVGKGGGSDVAPLVNEMRRLINSLPIMIGDAIERRA